MESIDSPEITFAEILRNNSPANEYCWTRTELITLTEATFLSYGIEPPDQFESITSFLGSNADYFLSKGDFLSVYKLSNNAVAAGKLQMFDNFRIEANIFVAWAKKQNIPILTDFFYKNPTEKPFDQKLNASSRKPTNESLRKAIMGMAGQIVRNQDEKKVQEGKNKKLSTKSSYLKNKKLQAIVKLVNEIGELDEVEGGIDLEWFKYIPNTWDLKSP